LVKKYQTPYDEATEEKERERYCKKYAYTMEPTDFYEQVKKCLDVMEVQWVHSIGEADHQLVRLFRDGEIVGILTNDGDFILHDSVVINSRFGILRSSNSGIGNQSSVRRSQHQLSATMPLLLPKKRVCIGGQRLKAQVM
jgi:hypothetical protein